VAPDAFDVGSGEQPFHLILKFLSYQIVFQNRYDQDFPELWHGLVSKNPAVNNFCSGEQRGDRHCEDGECQKGEAYTDIATSWEKTDSREFRWVHWHVIRLRVYGSRGGGLRVPCRRQRLADRLRFFIPCTALTGCQGRLAIRAKPS
jgi:hypothetical protein